MGHIDKDRVEIMNKENEKIVLEHITARLCEEMGIEGKVIWADDQENPIIVVNSTVEESYDFSNLISLAIPYKVTILCNSTGVRAWKRNVNKQLKTWLGKLTK